MESTVRKVKVKTLTNQIYDIEIDTSQPVSAFKQKISEVSSVPIDRQRLVYMGKLLLDDQPLNTYVKTDDQTVHLMARTESAPPVGQEGPAQQTQSGPTPPPPPQAMGFNPGAFMNQFNNLTGLVMRSMGNPADLGNIFSSLIGGVVPGPPMQEPNTQGSQPAPNTQPFRPNQPQPAQQQQVPNPTGQPSQPAPQHAQQHTIPHQHNHPHHQHAPHHHHQQHQRPPQQLPQQPPASSAQQGGPIVLPFNVLYTIGMLITQLNGEGAAFPGPPLPHMGNRNNMQVMGAFLSNWHFQMMRLLPYIYRLGELLQREPALQESTQREEVNSLLSRLAPILDHFVAATSAATIHYRNLRLGPNPGQFNLSPQPVPPMPINPLGLPGIINLGQQQQPGQIPVPPASAMQQLSGVVSQMPQVTISAIIQESVDNPTTGQAVDANGQPIEGQVIQQTTTITVPVGASLPGQPPQPGMFPFNILGMQFGQPSAPVPATAPPQQQSPRPPAGKQQQNQSQTTSTPATQQQSDANRTSSQPVSSTAPSLPSASSQQNQSPPARAPMDQQLNNVLQSNPILSSMLSDPAAMGMVTSMNVKTLMQSENPDQEESVYSLIFGEIQMSDLISSLTAQNFSYLTTHRQSMRRGTVQAISRFAGSRQALIEKMATDVANIIASEELRSSSMEGFDCTEVALDIARKHVARLIGLILSEQPDFQERFIKICKTLIGELVYELAEGNNQGPQGVIISLRASISRQYNPILMGLAGMAFGLIEGRIVGMFDEYRADLEREHARTVNDIQDEEQLIAAINRSTEDDREEIENILKKPHSPNY